ncbi:hypothetical protein B0H13DRAFT_1897797 [Mycena leptocephala]|nr:hypothetical protein B0H13DRAFT_1897797 [Mycena leptocephala]
MTPNASNNMISLSSLMIQAPWGPQDHDGPGTVSLWTRARAAIVELITAVVKHNPRGIRIIFLNSKHSKKVVKVTIVLDTRKAPTAMHIDSCRGYEALRYDNTWGLTPIGKKLLGILPYQHIWSVKEPTKKKVYFSPRDFENSTRWTSKKEVTRMSAVDGVDFDGFVSSVVEMDVGKDQRRRGPQDPVMVLAPEAIRAQSEVIQVEKIQSETFNLESKVLELRSWFTLRVNGTESGIRVYK